ncbi:putative entry exclusion protein TrbK-alt [Sphingopyxis witflariensis]|uniref:Conjugal transfer protein TrbK n=1 Tax=Sphingopyxis witflariensis TaxID=173675 RepID=A0A246K484_9SPHN|nr:putative entry exclusion protein TrbK-alt [Sphingopyxis witflariensis]OWR00380.1 hypothetical protein CDQ91_06440 [Sphingopyxis witflariensis]
MDRAGRIAGVAILGGLALTLALIAAVGPPEPGASAPAITRVEVPPASPPILRRCRTITVSDPGCEAAWEAKRQHFFGKKGDA